MKWIYVYIYIRRGQYIYIYIYIYIIFKIMILRKSISYYCNNYISLSIYSCNVWIQIICRSLVWRYCESARSNHLSCRSAVSRWRRACRPDRTADWPAWRADSSRGLSVVHLVIWPCKLCHRPANRSISNVFWRWRFNGQPPVRLSVWFLGVAKVDNGNVITSRWHSLNV